MLKLLTRKCLATKQTRRSIRWDWIKQKYRMVTKILMEIFYSSWQKGTEDTIGVSLLLNHVKSYCGKNARYSFMVLSRWWLKEVTKTSNIYYLWMRRIIPGGNSWMHTYGDLPFRLSSLQDIYVFHYLAVKAAPQFDFTHFCLSLIKVTVFITLIYHILQIWIPMNLIPDGLNKSRKQL